MALVEGLVNAGRVDDAENIFDTAWWEFVTLGEGTLMPGEEICGAGCVCVCDAGKEKIWS